MKKKKRNDILLKTSYLEFKLRLSRQSLQPKVPIITYFLGAISEIY